MSRVGIVALLVGFSLLLLLATGAFGFEVQPPFPFKNFHEAIGQGNALWPLIESKQGQCAQGPILIGVFGQPGVEVWYLYIAPWEDPRQVRVPFVMAYFHTPTQHPIWVVEGWVTPAGEFQVGAWTDYNPDIHAAGPCGFLLKQDV